MPDKALMFKKPGKQIVQKTDNWSVLALDPDRTFKDPGIDSRQVVRALVASMTLAILICQI